MFLKCLVLVIYVFVGIDLSIATSSIKTIAPTFDAVYIALGQFTIKADAAQSLRPVADVTDTLLVYLDMNMASLNAFDEANGYLEISGYLTVEWNATGYDPSRADVTEHVGNSVIWKPPILLVNSLKRSEEIGSDTSTKIRCNFFTRACEWKPWFIIQGCCTPNVKYYPFDKQSCSFKFAAWGYTNEEVLFTPRNSEWAFNFFEENGEWQIDKTSSEALVVNTISLVEFKIDFTRRPIYYVINLLAPIIILGIVNVFVFLLPADSGERIGFSITCFLAYVVMLNTVMAFLPSSAVPLSYLSYYTFVMMVFSAGMSLATIFTIRINQKSEKDPVPWVLRGLFQCLTCAWCNISGGSNRITKVTPNGSSNWDPEPGEEEMQRVSDSSAGDTKEEEITWKKIASFVDVILFFCFLGGQIFYSVSYILPLVFNA